MAKENPAPLAGGGRADFFSKHCAEDIPDDSQIQVAWNCRRFEIDRSRALLIAGLAFGGRQ